MFKMLNCMYGKTKSSSEKFIQFFTSHSLLSGIFKLFSYLLLLKFNWFTEFNNKYSFVQKKFKRIYLEKLKKK